MSTTRTPLALAAAIAMIAGAAPMTADAQPSRDELNAEELVDDAIIEMSHNNCKPAIVDLKKALDMSGEPLLLYYLGLAQECERVDDAAIESYEQYLIAAKDLKSRRYVNPTKRAPARIAQLKEARKQRRRFTDRRLEITTMFHKVRVRRNKLAARGINTAKWDDMLLGVAADALELNLDDRDPNQEARLRRASSVLNRLVAVEVELGEIEATPTKTGSTKLRVSGAIVGLAGIVAMAGGMYRELSSVDGMQDQTALNAALFLGGLSVTVLGGYLFFKGRGTSDVHDRETDRVARRGVSFAPTITSTGVFITAHGRM